MIWNQKKSQEKGRAAAVRAATGTGGGLGAVFIVIGVIESVFNIDIPGSVETLIYAVAAFMSGPVWTFIRTYYADKAKHGGNSISMPLPGFLPILLAAMLAWSALGCASHLCQLSETITSTDETGAPVTTTTKVRDYSLAWWKSTLDEGAGNVKYQYDENGVIELGSTSSGLQGGDATDLFLGIVQMMAPIVGDWVQGRQQISLLNAQKKSLIEQLISAGTQVAGSPAILPPAVEIPAQ